MAFGRLCGHLSVKCSNTKNPKSFPYDAMPGKVTKKNILKAMYNILLLLL